MSVQKVIYSTVVAVSFFLCLLYISLSPSGAQTENPSIKSSTPILLVESREKHNLIGFVPAEKNKSYVFNTKESAEEIIDSLMQKEVVLGFLTPLDFFKAHDKNIPLVALASPYQYPPVGFAYKQFVFQRGYEDFKGKRVLYEPNTLGEILFIHFLRQIQLSPSDVSWVPVAPDQKKSFEDADIVILDNLSEILHFSRNTETVRILFPYEFGIEFKGPLLVTSKAQLEENPDRIKSLTEKIFEQFQENIFNPKNIYSVFLQRSIPYIFESDKKLGELTEKDFWAMERVLLEEGILEKPVAYENSFENVLGKDLSSQSLPGIALPGPPSADFAGFYAAQDKGYFERTDNPIRFIHLSNESDVIDAVSEGKALLGTASALNILKAKEKYPDLTVLGVLYQQDPTTLIGLNPEVLKTKELIKKSAFLSSEKSFAGLLDSLEKHSLGWEELDVRIGYPSPLALLEHKIEVLAGRFAFEDFRWGPYRESFQILAPSDENSIGLAIFATQEVYEKNRDLIRKLLKAIYHGYEISVFQIEDSIESILAWDGSLSSRDLRALLKQNSNYLRDKNGIIGSIDLDKWIKLAHTAEERGFLQASVSVTELFADDAMIIEEIQVAK